MRKSDFSIALAMAAAACIPAVAQTGTIRLSALNHNFVSVPQGSSDKYGVKVTNEGDTPFPFALSLTGSPSYAKLTDCPDTLAAHASCEMVFVYTAPKNSTAWEEATFEIAANGRDFSPGNKGWLRAHPTPAGQIAFNSQKHNFLEVPVGQTGQGQSQPFGLMVANGAGKDVPITYTAKGDSGSFQVDNGCTGTLKANGQCFIKVAFAPQSAGWKKLEMTVNAGGTPVQNQGNVEFIGNGK